jgi:hypothetical protein
MYLKKQLRLIALLLIVSNLAGWAGEMDVSKKKEINQSFNVEPNDLLNVDNRYGSITVTYWDKNEVNIRVVVESKGSNERRAQEGLDMVQIELKKVANTVYGTTSIKTSIGNNSIWGNNNKLVIDYYISMPRKFVASLSQKYGNINLPGHNEVKYTLEVKYGNLKAGSFTQPLAIDAGYSNVILEDVARLDLEAKYCGNVSLGSGTDIRIDGQYSQFKLRNAAKLDIDNSYGNITAETINNFSAHIRYGAANIDVLKERLSARQLDYSSLTIKELDANFGSIDAEARYSTLKLSVSPQAAFRINAESMKYGNVEIKGLRITSSDVEDKVDYYYQINGGGNKTIHFEGNNYSSLKINAL